MGEERGGEERKRGEELEHFFQLISGPGFSCDAVSTSPGGSSRLAAVSDGR